MKPVASCEEFETVSIALRIQNNGIGRELERR
eukprot:CAMPEP_0117748700 /NCGR_PEP_ID=MMETSP0947-20121206/9299_1 /TAXON_ID=44440 /ORGANISM="Chattonella subsalsa, Strain CCMP2191" /LENGTH=31 /DNA_ID= /DNA_START= /DNA_END= /DNA_ORIENTATION=